MNTTPGGIVYGNMPTYPPGTLGVISGERGTYTAFYNDMDRAHMAMLVHDPRNSKITAMSRDPAGNSNELCRRMVGEWLWIMGDDHAFGPELLPQLLDHNVDVVVPHCLQRNPPWAPVVYSHQDEDGMYVIAELPKDELTQIWAAGSAGMLIRRRVLEAIDDPWFTPTRGAVGLNEDLGFCEKVREAGFSIWCDPAARLGHIAHYTVFPSWHHDSWNIDHVFDQKERFEITRPENIRDKAAA